MENLEAQQIVELRPDELFIGTVRYSVDDKGRVVVPVELRQRLGSEFYLTISPYDTVYLFAASDWQRYSQRLMEHYSANPQKLAPVVQRILGFANKVKVDGNWRFILPANLREACRLQKTVYFVGNGDRVELMNEEAYKQRASKVTAESVKELQAELGL
ncbi:Transcriptional regulator MraZ [bacterium HR17]|uniref:Transcriptional regulator MraZ n=1 Tax=Candidatus Fervidibacter japonicus TaxID=2035412 RepID=A0A2H5XDD8_9BACT|nr:Transcriptional regulator MraZ [bacterium HR17]